MLTIIDSITHDKVDIFINIYQATPGGLPICNRSPMFITEQFLLKCDMVVVSGNTQFLGPDRIAPNLKGSSVGRVFSTVMIRITMFVGKKFLKANDVELADLYFLKRIHCFSFYFLKAREESIV